MADEPDKTPIQNVYAQRFAKDLATNREEQDDTTTQIANLQERLEQLKAEETWLAQAQGSLPRTAAPEQREAGAVVDALGTAPQSKHDDQVKSADKKAAAKSRITSSKSRAASRKTAGKRANRPALYELILPILRRSPGHPHMAREVLDAFHEAHPEQTTSIQMVRNNLELLVKKNLAEKSRQQGAVMYVAITEQGATSAAGAETAEEQGVPAEV